MALIGTVQHGKLIPNLVIFRELFSPRLCFEAHYSAKNILSKHLNPPSLNLIPASILMTTKNIYVSKKNKIATIGYSNLCKNIKFAIYVQQPDT